jgi:hypothetical protein
MTSFTSHDIDICRMYYKLIDIEEVLHNSVFPTELFYNKLIFSCTSVTHPTHLRTKRLGLVTPNNWKYIVIKTSVSILLYIYIYIYIYVSLLPSGFVKSVTALVGCVVVIINNIHVRHMQISLDVYIYIYIYIYIYTYDSFVRLEFLH